MGNNAVNDLVAIVKLWFDVERIWETTSMEFAVSQMQLWFDVERIWETTSVDIS